MSEAKLDQEQLRTLSQILASQAVEIKTWDDFQAHLQSYRADHRYEWCFRGQANSEWPLAPSLERMIPNRRRESLVNAERILLDRFKRQAHQYLARVPEETARVDWYALMQHWGLPTRLLDFTLSPYVALFFALRERPTGCDACRPLHAAVWAIHHVSLQSLAKAELQSLAKAELQRVAKAELERGYRLDSAGFRKALDDLIGQDTDVRFVAPVQPFLMHERLASQQGMFLCPASLKLPFDILISQPKNFSLLVIPEEPKVKDSFARKLMFPLNERANMLRELSRMNINSASLFPGLDGYARSIRESYESLEGEEPAYKRIALETLEDFGWTG
jgi:hypothetical protein